MNFMDTFNEMVVILFAVGIGYLAHRLGYLAERSSRAFPADSEHHNSGPDPLLHGQ